MTVPIRKLKVHGTPGMSHCWAGIVGGKVIEYKGQPPRSVKAAKKAVASHLDQDVDSIEFEVGNG